MATTYEEIYDLFTVQIRDYELDALYTSSATNWATYLEGFLILSIPKFRNCAQDLTDRNDTTQTFNITLTDDENSILSELMVVEWLNRDIHDIRQMRLHLNDTDFKHYAEANNLNAKESAKSQIRNEVYQQMVEYGLDHTAWADWADGDYSGSL